MPNFLKIQTMTILITMKITIEYANRETDQESIAERFPADPYKI